MIVCIDIETLKNFKKSNDKNAYSSSPNDKAWNEAIDAIIQKSVPFKDIWPTIEKSFKDYNNEKKGKSAWQK